MVVVASVTTLIAVSVFQINVSVDLMEASSVLKKVKCLGLTGKEKDTYFSQPLSVPSQ